MKSCLHCGTRFSPASEDARFCCNGCEFVHGLIHDEGLDRFYDLRANSSGLPVLDRPFQPAEFGWLEERQKAAEDISRTDASRPSPSLRLHIRGLSCVGCIWLIEKLYQRVPGCGEIEIFPTNGRVELSWHTGQCDLPAFASELQRFGYHLEPFSNSGSEEDPLRNLAGRLGLCGAFALNSMVFTLPRYLGMSADFAFAGLFELITLISASLALLVGGSYFITRAWASLRQRVLHIDLPIALGITVAFAGSLVGWALSAHRLLYFDFVAIFTFLMLGGRYLQEFASSRVQRQLRTQSALPAEVTLDNEHRIPLDELQARSVYLVDSGEVVPVSSLLLDEEADFSLAWMTGEPTPVTISPGRRVTAGAINLNRQRIRVRAEEPMADSLVGSLVSQSTQSHRSLLLEKVLRIYLFVVLTLSLAGGMAWLLLARDPVAALQVSLSILVVSCPCALGVALPLVDQRAAAKLQERGVFVRTSTLWHRLIRIRKLLLDKTGTLTLERPQLSNPDVLGELTKEARKALAILSSSSLHPLARTLFEAVGGLTGPGESPVVEETPGRGVCFEGSSGRWSLGRPGWQGEPRESASRALASNLCHDGTLVAHFEFSETTRPDTRNTLHVLRDHFRMDASILSGDQPGRVATLATSVGMNPNQAHGGLSPDQKARIVRDLDEGDALYLGDGINDSLAFDAATASGTPACDRSVLDSKADFLFTTTSLDFLPPLFLMARWHQRTVRRILTLAIAYNLMAVGLCLAGLMSPLLAAILMPLSSLACLAIASGRQSARAPRHSPDARQPLDTGGRFASYPLTHPNDKPVTY